MNDTRFNEQEIDLLDLFWRLLEQWRGLLVAGLAFAVLFSAVMYVRSGNTAAAEIAEVTEETSTEDKYQQACTALSQYASYMLAKDTYSNSILNKNNFNDCNQVACTYQIHLEDSETDMYTVTSLYSIIASDSAFTDTMVNAASKYWEGVNQNSLYEIMTIATSQDTFSNDPRNGLLSVNFKLPADADVKEWQSALTTAINAYHTKVSSISGSHSVKPIVANSKKIDNTALTKQQNDNYSALITAKNTYDKTFTGLGKDDQALVEQIISEGDGSYDIEDYIGSLDKKLEELKSQAAVEATEPAPVQRSFSVKYFALGFILGAFLYACAYFVFFVFIRLVRGENDLYNAAGTRNFGGVYEYPFTTTLGRFLHDSKIYKFRTKKGKDIATISDDIISKLAFTGVKEFTIVSLGKLSDRAHILSDEQISYLKEHSITAKTLNIPDSAEDVRDSVFADLDNVLIELLGSRTKWTNLHGVYSKMKEYDVNVIGSEYLEV